MPLTLLTYIKLNKMKKILLMLVLCTAALIQSGYAQQDSAKTQPATLLNNYYALKDALVRSNSSLAATAVNEFINTLKADSAEFIIGEARSALLRDASDISNSKDIKLQREKFAALSLNMIELAKSTKLSASPVYLQYCPMKKASWLSNEQAIKNPYYGSAMLSCGSVKATY